eukprot:COSAG04_NODE_619_length_11882_cov_18.845880_10_plen_451_part_00
MEHLSAENPVVGAGAQASESVDTDDEERQQQQSLATAALNVDLAPLPDYLRAARGGLWAADGPRGRLARATLYVLTAAVFGWGVYDFFEVDMWIGRRTALIGTPLGLVALHAICAVAQPGGHLDQLGAYDGGIVPASAIESLERWKKLVMAFWVVVVVADVFLGQWFSIYHHHNGIKRNPDDVAPRQRSAGVGAACDAWILGILCVWLFSIKIATVLARASVRAAAASTNHALAVAKQGDGDAIDPAEWVAHIERPTLRLAETTLPTLSKGWGPSMLVLVAYGSLLAMSYFAYFLHQGYFGFAASSVSTQLDTSNSGMIVTFVSSVLIVVALTGPIWLAIDAATCSSECAAFEDSINKISVADLRMHAKVYPLLTTLRSLNKGQVTHHLPCCWIGRRFNVWRRALRNQGLGFVVGGHCVTRRTLYLSLTSVCEFMPRRTFMRPLSIWCRT